MPLCRAKGPTSVASIRIANAEIVEDAADLEA
jgi:hypothetical protein